MTTAPAHPAPITRSAATAPDLALLRAFEPVLRFTDGELFLPTRVDRYVARCSLWEGGPRRSAAALVPAGELTLDRLADLGEQYRDRPLYLRLVQQPLTRSQVRTWRRHTRPRLRSTARLAAVGLLARLVDVVLRLSLLVRGPPLAGLERMAGFVESVAAAAGVAEPLQMTVGVTDGERLCAVRYASGPEVNTLSTAPTSSPSGCSTRRRNGSSTSPRSPGWSSPSRSWRCPGSGTRSLPAPPWSWRREWSTRSRSPRADPAAVQRGALR
jgi:hypothetical protein